MGVYIPLPRQYIGMFLISLFAGNGKHIGTGLHLIPMCVNDHPPGRDLSLT